MRFVDAKASRISRRTVSSSITLLRKYQQRIVDATREQIRFGFRRPVVVAPTGSGKTHIATAIIKAVQDNKLRSIFLAPRRELIYQTLEKFNAYGVEAGMIMSGEPQRLYARTQVCSFDTLHARAIQRDKIELPDADLVVVDEAHLSMSPAKLQILNHYKNKIVIGLTATPCRSDGTGLGKFYNALVNEVSVRELIDEGYLVEPEYWAPAKWDMSAVRQTKSDYVLSSLGKAVNKPELIGGIYDNWKRIAADKRTVIFCVNRNHSRHVRDQFLHHGVAAEHVDGDTPKGERADIFERVRSGATQVLTNVYVASYGLDIPALECAVLARPTKSLGLYIQTCGRVLRPSPDTGKSGCTIIDHTGAIEEEHGYLDSAVPWSLDGTDIREKKKKEEQERGDPKEITCINCGRVFSGQRECPKCGFSMVPPTEDVPHKKVDLRKIAKTSPATFYAMLVQYGKDMDYKPGWAKYKYHEKFKSWPRMQVNPETPNREVMNFIKSRNIAYNRRKKA